MAVHRSVRAGAIIVRSVVLLCGSSSVVQFLQRDRAHRSTSSCIIDDCFTISRPLIGTALRSEVDPPALDVSGSGTASPQAMSSGCLDLHESASGGNKRIKHDVRRYPLLK